MELALPADRAPHYDDLLRTLPKKERRGSRARCILLTDGPNEAVAVRLSSLGAPFASINPHLDRWMPRGFADPKEAKLGEAPAFLSSEQRQAVTAWWLAVREHANTPNWDIASTATINGIKGLLLVEAKAHGSELRADGKINKGRPENHVRIQAACRDASAALCRPTARLTKKMTRSTARHRPVRKRCLAASQAPSRRNWPQ
jgi:hypothetical protein